MMSVRVEYEIEVKDRHGKVIKREKGESKSLLKNFVAVLRAMMLGTVDTRDDTGGTAVTGGATGTVKDLTGADKTIWGGGRHPNNRAGGWPLAIDAQDDDDTYGIVVGKGDAPVSAEDYALDDQIPHGTETGKLDYGTHTFEDVVVEDKVSKFRVSRRFTNLSGASVTVKEIGIIAWNYWRDYTTIRADVKFLFVRDVLTSPTTIPDGASLNVRYTFSVEA